MKSLKQILDYYADLKNCDADLFGAPDPLQVAKGHRNDVAALICALFAYGSAAQILKFLRSLDFSLLDGSDERIRAELAGKKYRFQSSRDVAEIFITLKRLKNSLSIEESVLCGMLKSGRIEDGINFLISEIYKLNPYRSPGYEFFLGAASRKSPHRHISATIFSCAGRCATATSIWGCTKRSKNRASSSRSIPTRIKFHLSLG